MSEEASCMSFVPKRGLSITSELICKLLGIVNILSAMYSCYWCEISCCKLIGRGEVWFYSFSSILLSHHTSCEHAGREDSEPDLTARLPITDAVL